jgi:hypothetical protein
MFELVSALLAVVLLVGIAFPQLLTLLQKDPEKKVGSSYWGVYDGTPLTDLHDKKIAQAGTQVARRRRQPHVRGPQITHRIWCRTI